MTMDIQTTAFIDSLKKQIANYAVAVAELEAAVAVLKADALKQQNSNNVPQQ